MNSIISWDVRAFTYCQQIIGRWHWFDLLVEMCALYLVYLVPLVLIIGWFWSEQTKRVAFKAGMAGIIAWLGVSKTIAAFASRARPSVALMGHKEIMFNRPDHSFPSDHTSAIFAVAMVVRLSGHKKLGNALFVIGILIGISRLLAGVHYPLDVIGGVLVGCIVGYIVWMLRKQIDKSITMPFIAIMKKVKL